MDWLPFTTTNINVNLGATDGVYNVNVGLRGDPTGAVQTWNHYTFRLDRVAPVLTITNPVLVHAAATVTKPYLQLQGYADKPLASLSYDLNNAALSVTQQDAFVTDQVFDTNQFDFTTNFFQAFDVPLTNGLNSLTLRATDRAGNTTTTQFTVTLDYTTATAPPVVNVIWPQDQMAVSGTSLTIRGTMSDETGTILAQVTDANHNVTPVPGLVERNNMFWIENVPLNATGSTPITIQATDAAGNVTSVPLTVLPSSHTLTIDSTPTGTDLYQPSGSVTGSVGDASATVTVNGMPATITTENSDGTYEWEADNVPIYGIGTATFDAVAISASTSSASSGGGNSEMQPADRAQPMDTSPPGDNVSAEVEMPAAWIFASYNCGETHYYDYGTFKGYPSYKCDYFTCAYTGSLAPGAGGRWSSTYAGTYFNYDIFDWGDGDVDPTPTTTTIGWSDQNPFGIKMYVSGGQTTMTQFQDGYPYGISGNSSFYNAYPNGMSWNQMFVPRQDLEGDPEDHPIYMVEYYADDVGYTWNLGGSTHSFSMAARSQVKLYTGGKAPVARSSLFCIGASAVEYPDLPADWQGAPSTPIPNTKLVVLKKSVGSDGNLWVVLPDNSPGVDITVSAPGYKHFNALFGQQKYRLDVTATVNGITDDISANTPTFCVGQEVNLTVQWTPSLPENPKRSSGKWVLGGEYIDSSFQPTPTYSVIYTNDPSLLKNETASIWWVSGGCDNPPTYRTDFGEGLTFANGQYATVAANGKIMMYSPQIVNFAPTTQAAVVLDTTSGFYMGLGHDSVFANGQNRMYWQMRVNVNPAFTGSLRNVQLIGLWAEHDGYYEPDTDGEFWLDGFNPYPYETIPVDDGTILPIQLYHSDTPSITPSISGNFHSIVERKDSFLTYAEFMPDGGIPISIGLVSWGWHGKATADANGLWNLDIKEITGPYFFPGNTLPPEWPNTFTAQ